MITQKLKILNEIEDDDMILDIGPKTIDKIKKIKKIIDE